MSVPVLPRCHAVVMLATSNGFAAKLDGRMRGSSQTGRVGGVGRMKGP
jgi:hypothetical protein